MKETIIKLIESGELDKLINQKWTPSYGALGVTRAEVRRERKQAKRFKKELDAWTGKGNKLREIPFVLLVHFCDCPSLLKSAILLYKGGGKDE